MIVYKFYSKPSEDLLQNSEDLAIEDKYPLYAFTNKKSYRKDFKQNRDMNKFIELKTEISDEEFVQYANINRSSMLDMYKFQYFQGYGKSIPETDILCTWREKEIVCASLDDGMIDTNNELSYEWFPFILKNKYVDALKTLQFISYWKMYGPKELYNGLYTYDEEHDMMDYSYPPVQYDEVAMFIYLFGNTFK